MNRPKKKIFSSSWYIKCCIRLSFLICLMSLANPTSQRAIKINPRVNVYNPYKPSEKLPGIHCNFVLPNKSYCAQGPFDTIEYAKHRLLEHGELYTAIIHDDQFKPLQFVMDGQNRTIYVANDYSIRLLNHIMMQWSIHPIEGKLVLLSPKNETLDDCKLLSDYPEIFDSNSTKDYPQGVYRLQYYVETPSSSQGSNATSTTSSCLCPLKTRRRKRSNEDEDDTNKYCCDMPEDFSKKLLEKDLRPAMPSTDMFMEVLRHQTAFLGEFEHPTILSKRFFKIKNSDEMQQLKDKLDKNRDKFASQKVICKTFGKVFKVNLQCYFCGEDCPFDGSEPEQEKAKAKLSVGYCNGKYYSLVDQRRLPLNYDGSSLNEAHGRVTRNLIELSKAVKDLGTHSQIALLEDGTPLYVPLCITASRMEIIARKNFDGNQMAKLYEDAIKPSHTPSTWTKSTKSSTTKISAFTPTDVQDPVSDDDVSILTQQTQLYNVDEDEEALSEIVDVIDEDETDDDGGKENPKLNKPVLGNQYIKVYEKYPEGFWYSGYKSGRIVKPSLFTPLIIPSKGTVEYLGPQMKPFTSPPRYSGIPALDYGIRHEQDGVNKLAEALKIPISHFKESGIIMDATGQIRGIPDRIVNIEGEDIPIEVKSSYSCRDVESIEQFKEEYPSVFASYFEKVTKQADIVEEDEEEEEPEGEEEQEEEEGEEEEDGVAKNEGHIKQEKRQKVNVPTYIISRKSRAFWQLQSYLYLMDVQFGYITIFCHHFSIHEKIIRHPKLEQVMEKAHDAQSTLMRLVLIQSPAVMGVPKVKQLPYKGLGGVIDETIKTMGVNGFFLTELQKEVIKKAATNPVMQKLSKEAMSYQVTWKVISMAKSDKVINPRGFFRRIRFFRDRLYCLKESENTIIAKMDAKAYTGDTSEYDNRNVPDCTVDPKEDTVYGPLCHAIYEILEEYGSVGLFKREILQKLESDANAKQILTRAEKRTMGKTGALTRTLSNYFDEDTENCKEGDSKRPNCAWVLHAHHHPPKYPGMRSRIRCKLLDKILDLFEDGAIHSKTEVYAYIKQFDQELSDVDPDWELPTDHGKYPKQLHNLLNTDTILVKENYVKWVGVSFYKIGSKGRELRGLPPVADDGLSKDDLKKHPCLKYSGMFSKMQCVLLDKVLDFLQDDEIRTRREIYEHLKEKFDQELSGINLQWKYTAPKQNIPDTIRCVLRPDRVPVKKDYLEKVGASFRIGTKGRDLLGLPPRASGSKLSEDDLQKNPCLDFPTMKSKIQCALLLKVLQFLNKDDKQHDLQQIYTYVKQFADELRVFDNDWENKGSLKAPLSLVKLLSGERGAVTHEYITKAGRGKYLIGPKGKEVLAKKSGSDDVQPSTSKKSGSRGDAQPSTSQTIPKRRKEPESESDDDDFQTVKKKKKPTT